MKYWKKFSIVLLSGFVLIKNPMVVTAEEVEQTEYLDELDTWNSEMEVLLQNEKSTKKQITDKFIEFVDFIFYDAEINNIKFKDLTTEGKNKAISILISIDEKIEKKFPNYQNNLQEKYQTIIKFIKDKNNKLSNKIENKIGEENYQELIDDIEEMKDYTKKGIQIIKYTGSKGKQKIKTWYEDLKERQ